VRCTASSARWSSTTATAGSRSPVAGVRAARHQRAVHVLLPGISIGGHLGGLAGGALAALLVLGAERRRSTPLALAGCAAVAVVAVVGAIVASGASVY
jgi:hypothetical protein